MVIPVLKKVELYMLQELVLISQMINQQILQKILLGLDLIPMDFVLA